MQSSNFGRGRVVTAITAGLVIITAAAAALVARTQAQAPPTTAAPVSARRPLVPVAATTLLANPKAYIGEQVSLSAAVERIVSPTAFTVDQDASRATGQEVLVLAPGLSSPVKVNGRVTVLGEVLELTPEALSSRVKEAKIELAPEIINGFAGRLAVLARTVIAANGLDLTRRLPPPMTPDDATLSKVMQRVGPAFAELRKILEATPPTAPTTQTALLKRAFAETQSFWKARGKADAAAWAEEAKSHVTGIERAAATANWEVARSAAGALGKTCQTCHTTYRDRFDDGSFRITIKPATTTQPG